MSRPIRINYHNAWYHVMNRGANHQPVFNADNQRYYFLHLLSEATDTFNLEVHAYCLMGNHYHLLVRTPDANLARAMQHINGAYTQAFNRDEGRDGPLFRGRYKSILVDEDGYQLIISRYIHLNPVDAKMVILPENYHWSSYKDYIGLRKKPNWLFTDNISTQFKDRPSLQQIGSYRNFVEAGNPRELIKFYSRKYTAPIIGSAKFKKKISSGLDEHVSGSHNYELNKLKKSHAINQIITNVANFYNVTKESMYQSSRSKENTPRMIAIYICKKYYDFSLAEIALALKNLTPAAVSKINIRCKEEVKKGNILIECCVASIKRGQTSTFNSEPSSELKVEV